MEWEGASPQEILQDALRLIPNITFACSFGAEDMVLLDMLMALDVRAHVFYLDTNVLFPETYALRDEAVERYGIPNLRQVLPDVTLSEQARVYGEALWARDPNRCCLIRKVQPLERVLSAYDGWITGIRREQAPTRANAKVVEWDAKFGLVKVNPLVRWTEGQVWRYIREHKVPYNPLHDQNYPSIGCLHCTKPVQPGEDPRSGRWAGFDKTECGLHR
ncbi:MAG: phosphoadenylyl-sulfate reductase [Alicyclobacillus sp.]|nr:phosphoadenylyl-sulfate reductase [Alicyclobacillus sp.]